MTDTLSMLIEIGNRLGVDTAAPFKHDEVWKTVRGVAPQHLNVRDGAGIEHGLVGYLFEGDMVNVVQSINGWSLIVYNSGTITGWCSEAYLK
jgi:uncharacterized protein YgiM (DUF1202 family)